MLHSLKVATPTDCEIVMTRDFNAPRHLVWEAMTKPEIIRKWLSGPPGWTMTTCDDDARPGGSFRWAWRGPNSEDLAMRGVYSEVVPPASEGKGGRIVRTESFDIGCGPQAGEQHCTLTLTEGNGRKTTLTLTIRFPSKEARDGAIASGMSEGVSAGHDRLEEILAANG